MVDESSSATADLSAASAAPPSAAHMSMFTADAVSACREIGDQAVFRVSSAKNAFGAVALRDGSAETYWQSDGAQPHTVSIAFRKRLAINYLAVTLDYKQDESYTPRELQIRHGPSHNDLEFIDTYAVEEPSGTVLIDLAGEIGVLKTSMLLLSVTANHQNGRDTRVRDIRVYGPRDPTILPLAINETTSLELTSFAQLR